MPPNTLKLAVAQAYTLSTLNDTLDALEATTRQAASQGVDLILFPEAYLGGYPRTGSFGAAVCTRSEEGREQFLHYFKAAVDLGDTPRGGGDTWVDRSLPVPTGHKYRGDGTRERLEAIARHTGVFVVTGLVEKSGGNLYCSAVYVDPRRGCIGKRRKIMPTGSERMVWAQGCPSTLRAVRAEIKGVKIIMAAVICWENHLPLLRYSLYSQDVNLYLASTADARETWLALMQTIGTEGRTFVLSANQCTRKNRLPAGITAESPQVSSGTGEPTGHRPHELALPAGSSSTSTEPEESDPIVCRGGSCIVGPLGQVLAEPLWEVEDGGLLIVDADFDDCESLDVAGSYSRKDTFTFTVNELDIDPLP